MIVTSIKLKFMVLRLESQFDTQKVKRIFLNNQLQLVTPTVMMQVVILLMIYTINHVF